MADVMVDLFMLACVMARVTDTIEREGIGKCERELEIARVFAGQAKVRITRNFRQIDDNDDELIKSIANHAFESGGYSWDSI